jgi:hypothetical protein
MIVSNYLRVVDWWSGIDGEPYVGDQGQSFDEQQEQQETFDQRKYKLEPSLLHTHF